MMPRDDLLDERAELPEDLDLVITVTSSMEGVRRTSDMDLILFRPLHDFPIALAVLHSVTAPTASFTSLIG